MAAAAKKRAAQGDSVKKRPVSAAGDVVEITPPPDKIEDQPKSAYPEGVEVWTYQPIDGSAEILLPLNGFPPPDKLWLFDTAQMPWLSQTWAWMRKALVPSAIQRQAQMLPDKEYFDMLDAWMDAMKDARGGGPKGAVTAGK